MALKGSAAVCRLARKCEKIYDRKRSSLLSLVIKVLYDLPLLCSDGKNGRFTFFVFLSSLFDVESSIK